MLPGDEVPSEDSRGLREALILDLARARPGFQRELSGDVCEAERSSPTCGDRILIRVELRDGVLAEAGWDGRGCAVSTASAGVLTGMVPGTPIEQLPQLLENVRRMVERRSATAAGTPEVGDMRLFSGMGRLPLRGRCALLSWEALADAVPEIARPERG